MAKGRQFFVVAFGLLVWVTVTVLAVCNECGPSNVACVSETQYRTCDPTTGTPEGIVYSCPAGQVCSTSQPLFCQPNDTNVVLTCQQCNLCDVSKVFACIGRAEYALCLGTDLPSTVTGSCGPNLVCHINNPNMCIAETSTTLASCASDTIATTAAPSTTNPVTYCRSVQKNGRYAVGNALTTTCKQYIYCFPNGGVWSGAIYECPGSTYFNSTSSMCTTAPETRCI